jgi:hypothetical protein
MPAFRSVVTALLRLVVRTFSTNFKAGPEGGGGRGGGCG